MSLLNSLKQWSYERKLTVIAVLHDLNMASLYCDRVLLLNEGKIDCIRIHQLDVMEEKQLERFTKVASTQRTSSGSKPANYVYPRANEKISSAIKGLNIEQITMNGL